MNSMLLRWVERGLLALGIGLGVWCAAVLIETRYISELPIPRAAAVLPADRGDTAARNANTPRSIAAPVAGSWVARLTAPSVDLTATVLEGTDDATLNRGAGHIEETALPGQAGNIGIAGHRDTIFRPVRKLHVGDVLDLTTPDHTYTYRITKTFIVGPDDVYVLDPGPRPMLTLVTCYPFEFIGHAPQRFIVQAELATDQASAAGAAK
jgi:sortase A